MNQFVYSAPNCYADWVECEPHSDVLFPLKIFSCIKIEETNLETANGVIVVRIMILIISIVTIYLYRCHFSPSPELT